MTQFITSEGVKMFIRQYYTEGKVIYPDWEAALLAYIKRAIESQYSRESDLIFALDFCLQIGLISQQMYDLMLAEFHKKHPFGTK